jgi:hypothetical protein
MNDDSVFEMSEPAVIDWSSTRNKGVRSFDGQSIGVVVAEKKGEEYFTVESTSGHKKYRIPKNKVEGFDGRELKLSLTLKEAFDYSANI